MKRILPCPIIASLLLLCAHGALATTFTVPDGDVATLKTAINTANTNGQDDIIELAANGSYTLTTADSFSSGLPQLRADGGKMLLIHGNGATIRRSSAGGTPTFRIFYIASGANVTLSRLTLANGNLAAHGGAIYNDGEEADTSLTLVNCLLSGNTGDYGGAIYNDGYNSGVGPSTASLTIINSTISANFGTQYGGGIWNDGSFGHAVLTISNSTFTQNAANLDTGAIQHDAFMGLATGSITNCTFSLNSSGRNGGAIYIDGEDGSAMLSVNDCTFSQNSATTAGGGIYVSTGVDGGTATLQLKSNIFQTGASGANLVNAGGAITSLGYNLSDDSGGGFLTATGDQTLTDPMLDPAGLQNNGGPTQTIALLGTSPAINTGDPGAPARDQRSYIRAGAPDKGAFEFGGTAVPVQLLSGASVKTHGSAGSFSLNLPLTGSAGIECRSSAGAHTLVFTFANPLTSVGSASFASGAGTVSSSAIGADPHQYIVNLSAVPNEQIITVNLLNVTDSTGNYSPSVALSMGVLAGDVNLNRLVNVGDVIQTRNRSGQTTDATNFRFDVNIDGVINNGDLIIVRTNSGTTLP